ncbi:MAG: argininosuccinate lyase, partial [Candidatus Micrarchaeota archaeon]
MKIWSKKGEDVPKEVEGFLSGEDIMLDRKLITWDAIGSIAHVKVLAKAGVLSKSESEKLILGLKKVIALDQGGKFELKEELEDVHA